MTREAWLGNMGEVHELGGGVFRTLVGVEKAGLPKESVMMEMPEFGYMVWSKSGELVDERGVREKIRAGARVVTMLSGLDAEPGQFDEMASEILEGDEGEGELLVLGLANPGFWMQQYEGKRMMSVGDVSVYKYVLMVLEWAQHMGLDKRNNLIVGHSAGGEAAVWLSKWFRVMGLSPALHLDSDVNFVGISKANILANEMETHAWRLGGVVNLAQQSVVALFSGSGVGTELHDSHMERLGDGGGDSHDLKVVELCREDELPEFAPNPDDLRIMGGRKDILTRYKKLMSWLQQWQENKGGESDWEMVSEWFPEEARRRMKHDTVLVDGEAIGLVAAEAREMLRGLRGVKAVEITDKDLIWLRERVAGLEDLRGEVVMETLSQMDKIRRGFTISSHREIGMVEYLDTKVHEKVVEFLERVVAFENDNEAFLRWTKEGEGNKEWLGLAVEMLGRARTEEGEEVFTEEELEAIGEGRLRLTDESVRARVAEFPRRNEWAGWLTVPEMQVSEFRGRGARGDTLDPAVYLLTDLILRRMSGMGEEDESAWELMAVPMKLRLGSGGVLERLRMWHEMWVLDKRGF